jgi:chromosome segregation ATPase
MFRITRWAIALAVATGTLFTTDLGSYFSTAWSGVTSACREAVPIEFEIARAEQQLAALDSELTDFRQQLAEIEVSAEESGSELTRLDAAIQGEERELAARVELLAPDRGAGAELTTEQRRRITTEVQRMTERLKAKRSAREAKASVHEHQSEAARIATERLSVVHAQREQLRVDIEKLRAQNLAVETQATLQGSLALDTSAIGDARRTLAEVSRRLKVSERVLAEEPPLTLDPLETELREELVLAEARELLEGTVTR